MEKKYNFDKVRQLKIYTSQDKMQAYISIKYIEEIIRKNVTSAFYTASDIKSELAKAGIIFGIIDIPIQEYGQSNCVNQLIAKGKRCVEPIDDKITMNFNTGKGFKDLVQEINGNIDFKSIGSIEAIHIGDVIAFCTKGTPGIDGSDVFGNIIKHKQLKTI